VISGHSYREAESAARRSSALQETSAQIAFSTASDPQKSQQALLELRHRLTAENLLDGAAASAMAEALSPGLPTGRRIQIASSVWDRAEEFRDVSQSRSRFGQAFVTLAGMLAGVATFAWLRPRYLRQAASGSVSADAWEAAVNRLDVQDTTIKELESELTQLKAERLSDQIDLADLQTIQSVTRQRYQSLFAGLPLACFTVNEYSHIVEWNDAATSVFGLQPHEVLDRPIWETVLVDDPDGRAKALMGTAFLGESVDPVEWHVRSVDGATKITTWAAVPVRSGHGQVVGVLCSFLDRTTEALAKSDLEAASRFNREITNLCPDLVYVMDLRTHANVMVNNRISAILGYTQAEIDGFGGRLLNELVHPDDVHSVIRNHLGVADLEDGAVATYQYRMKSKQGLWVWLESYEVVFERDNDGNAVTKLGYARDVTHRKEAEEKLLASESRFRTVVDSMHDGFIFQLGDGRVTMANDQAAEILGTSVKDLLNVRDVAGLLGSEAHGDSSHETQEGFTLAPVRDLVVWRVGPDGQDQWLEIDVTPILRPSQNDSIATVTIFRDVTERIRAEDQTRRHVAELSGARAELESRSRELERANLRWELLAMTDGLTGLANHRALQEQLSHDLDQFRLGRMPAHSVVMIDVDHFKQFNDRFGHVAGDDVLRTVGQILEDCAPKTAKVGRYGGEEFLVLLPNHARDEALACAEALRTAIEGFAWRLAPVTASFGVATLIDPDMATGAYVQAADRALYAAKEQGRNRTVHADSAHDPLAA